MAGAGIALAACGGDEPTEQPTAGGATNSPVDGEQAVSGALEAAGIEGPPVLTVLVATFEMLTGEGRRMQFALLDEQGTPLLDEDVEAYLVRASDQVVATGPTTPTFYGGELGDRGVYVFESGLEEPGLYDLVVATPDKSRAGTAAVRVIRPEESALPLAGDPFPTVETPTNEDPKDLEELCTRDPECGMHGTSLATALDNGSPVVLTIATPKYCSSRICGPVVDVVLGVKEDLGRDDVVFIHAEVFTDAGNTPTEIVSELQLPTEPWTFVINGDGSLADRFDGPVVPELLSAAVQQV
ncbi:MAG: hypothetical protein R3320_00445 [Nitriliruptorales bacterium]|nr:hypothetical protein [Nitriliruptorales bacterium]